MLREIKWRRHTLSTEGEGKLGRKGVRRLGAEENSSKTSRQVSDPMTDTKSGCGSNMARLELGRKSRSFEF